MNFAAGRIFTRLKNRSTISQYVERETVHSLFCANINIQTRNKARLAKPKIFELQNASKDLYRQQHPIGIYGYILLAVPIGTFILGTWQVQRRKWKINLIEQLKERTQAEPVSLPERMEELKTKEYCRVNVRGTFLHDKEFIVGPRGLIINGSPANEGNTGIFSSGSTGKGYCVITPFKLADRDLTILVNRGWVPQHQKRPNVRKEAQVEGEVHITGVIRLTEARPAFVPANSPEKGVWVYRDINAMAKYAGTDPIYIEQTVDNHIPGGPIGGQTKIVLRNEHLSYIFTWYSLSAFTGYMWCKQFLMKVAI